MLESKLLNLKLENFRNFQRGEFTFASNQVLIIGSNGSGKTSILEAISLLSAGKGLKASKFSEQINFLEKEWSLTFNLDSYLGNIIIEQNHSHSNNKRNLLLNSRNITASELHKFTNIFWLTPQLNGLFQESQSDRRRFYDRIVYTFTPEHATNIRKYEHYQTERLKILTAGYYDSNWVDLVENKLAELAIKIAEARLRTQNLLQKAIDKLDTSFPKIQVILESRLEDIIKNDATPYSEIKKQYEISRNDDTKTHRNHFGALKTDFFVYHKVKNVAAKFCSTGEQQACLISLLLGHTEAFIHEEGKKPLLLLDELFVHLDHSHRAFLTSYISSQKIQTIVTTTEKNLCEEFAASADIISL